MKYLFLSILKVVQVTRYNDLNLNARNKRWAQSCGALMMQGALAAAFTVLQGITQVMCIEALIKLLPLCV